ncbi:MAG: hypothetical protein NCW75_14960 [Phycisphaera sp.]|nr:MAG: hypothetical protein NCW75_14960 [Phycisphaera sp.]
MSDGQHNHDDWFAHTRDEGLPQQEHSGHVDTKALLIFYMGMVAFVVVSIIGVTLFFQRYVLGVRQDRLETLQLAVEANEYKATTLEELGEYGWSGETVQGAARIPLEEARAKVMQSYGQ